MTSPLDMFFSAGFTIMQASEYLFDSAQRSILFWDLIRKRGNNYTDHLKQGQPPVLAFDHEVIMDGSSFDPPVNYQLVRITGPSGTTQSLAGPNGKTKKTSKRPIVVVDPRAGHGPGISGSKMDSQIGTALKIGHPVYFFTFSTRPVPGQTIAHVQLCHIRFLEEVAKRHQGPLKPVVIGNCQGGWASALVAADRPDLTGPLILNGSPLSYWGGVRGENPMRYRGGILGGTWLVSLSSDLGNQIFDGAHLVAGFESLNIANTFWKKLYTVYSRIDTEESRFLDFEKWWGGFFLLTSEEIHFIVKNLFIGDKLEQGILRLDRDHVTNLKNVKSPILIFASKGDNITPPQQALNWIAKIYGSVDEIKQRGQAIVYLIHESIGHLGIFVSGKINRKEHKKIINCVEAIDFLAPGLYEMIIRDEKAGPMPEKQGQEVDFATRDISDILAMDDGFEDEKPFFPAAAISNLNDHLYQEFASPWINLFTNEITAELLRQSHPLRVQRYLFSDINPWMTYFKMAAPTVTKFRQPVSRDNVFLKAENTISDMVVNSLSHVQKNLDLACEALFYNMYDNPWIARLWEHTIHGQESRQPDPEPEKSELFKNLEEELWISAMKKGGVVQAVIRIILAVTSANHIFNMAEYEAARFGMKNDERLKQVEPEQLKKVIKNQAALLEKDMDMALSTLCDLLPLRQDRMAALDIARSIAGIEAVKKFKKTAVLKKIKFLLSGKQPTKAQFS